MSSHKHPNVVIKPLNFDEPINDENDENNDPGPSDASFMEEDVTIISEYSESIVLDDTTDSSRTAFNCSSASFMEAHQKLQRPPYDYGTPKSAKYIERKTKYLDCPSSYLVLSNMPNEVINRVFSFLNKRDLLAMGSTCKRFYEVTSTQAHWHSVNLYGKKVMETSIHRMISRKSKILNLTSSTVLADHALILPRELTLCTLTKLDVSYAKFPDNSLSMIKTLFKRCIHLEHLALEHQPVDAELLSMIAKNPRLSTLSLSSCQVIDARSLSQIFKSCNKLTELNMGWTHPCEATARVLINEIPETVVRLSIPGMQDREAFNDAGLIKLIQRLPNLVEIDIGDNNRVTSEFIHVLCKHPKIETFTASRCYKIEPVAYTLLKHIKSMNLFGTLSNAGYAYMREHIPQVALNQSQFNSIARSQELDAKSDMFWGEDIGEPY